MISPYLVKTRSLLKGILFRKRLVRGIKLHSHPLETAACLESEGSCLDYLGSGINSCPDHTLSLESVSISFYSSSIKTYLFVRSLHILWEPSEMFFTHCFLPQPPHSEVDVTLGRGILEFVT